MKKKLIFLTLLVANIANGQDLDTLNSLSQLLRLSLDSIEIRSSIYNCDTNVVSYFYISYENISTDTITVVTNSCPHSNQYKIRIGHDTLITNTNIRCFGNMTSPHLLPPGTLFQIIEEISNYPYAEDKSWIDNYELIIYFSEQTKNEFEVTTGNWFLAKNYLSCNGTVQHFKTEHKKYSKKYLRIKRKKKSVDPCLSS